MSNVVPSIWDQVKPKARRPICHPDRKHKGHGLCRPCLVALRRAQQDMKPAVNREEAIKRAQAAKIKKVTAYHAGVEARLTGIHCSLCGIDFNPNMKHDKQHPDICSECEKEILRSAEIWIDLTPHEEEYLRPIGWKIKKVA